jgi:hypothetical protein
MSVSFQIKSGAVILVLEGDHLLSEERQALADAIADPCFVVPLPLLVDARRSTANPDISSIAERARCLGTLEACLTSRCAIVVASPLQCDLARMLATYAEKQGLSVGVFWEKRSARHWLATTVSQAEQVFS